MKCHLRKRTSCTLFHVVLTFVLFLRCPQAITLTCIPHSIKLSVPYLSKAHAYVPTWLEFALIRFCYIQVMSQVAIFQVLIPPPSFFLPLAFKGLMTAQPTTFGINGMIINSICCLFGYFGGHFLLTKVFLLWSVCVSCCKDAEVGTHVRFKLLWVAYSV